MKPIPPTPSRTEQTYQAILDQICTGALTPGTHLVQEQLAARLGVSRQPIQQAMALLKSDGLVQEIGGRGLCVAPLDLDAMRERYEVRAALDALAARLAASRAAAAQEVAREIGRGGSEIIAAGETATAAGDIPRMVERDVAFHRYLYEVSGNGLVAATAEPHWRYLRRVMGDVLRHAEDGGSIWEQHAEILDAVVAGNADEAAARATAHVERAARRLSAALSGQADGREAGVAGNAQPVSGKDADR
ncbi:GntR family transcriptional regulator [Limibaculum sp. M0105]|uniref:GntR family transcriptional regulator n=1 Tax=Thermohalobaculum xanthum TaxID=2753746 RepID=A0A8J7M8R4_9RHOB|nr:GntR family transcriptional regulator [Thermohalobaculum xanthum]MBK0399783.1 GntR family transcriptional regulator [Thermohalobaculum xanthum]